ncbi:MAG: hypothetical protein HYZ53_09040 [Planctomycetes bacterium]|nr:hypothetical protein [Planctomycetota bacterium]
MATPLRLWELLLFTALVASCMGLGLPKAHVPNESVGLWIALFGASLSVAGVTFALDDSGWAEGARFHLSGQVSLFLNAGAGLFMVFLMRSYTAEASRIPETHVDMMSWPCCGLLGLPVPVLFAFQNAFETRETRRVWRWVPAAFVFCQAAPTLYALLGGS